MKANKEVKSSVFADLFCDDEKVGKKNFLSLYNAIHDTNFKIGEVEIKPVTLENVVYNNIENDVSMEINDSIVVLAEHQSTINNNMPFRCLEYPTASSPTMTSTTRRKSSFPARNVTFFTTETMLSRRKKS